MDNMRLYGIRGAWCAENNDGSIRKAVGTMVSAILEKNSLHEDNIVSVHFTVTNDLDVLNPAAALRKEGLCLNSALFCSLEPNCKGAISHTIRVLITAYLDTKPVHIYGGGAEVLRPDFVHKANG